MCRTIRMHPTDYVTIGPLKGLTFLPDLNLFDYEAPENECYCPATATGTILTYFEKKSQKLPFHNEIFRLLGPLLWITSHTT